MQVRILGCSGTIAKGCRTTSFLLGERVLVDAGTGVGQLTLEEMQRIDHVFLTHSHLDHIAALPLMLDAVGANRRRPLEVHALPQTLAALHAHVFNDVIWPDFTRIPSPAAPFVRLSPWASAMYSSAPASRWRCCPHAIACPPWATPRVALSVGGSIAAIPRAMSQDSGAA